MTSQRLRTRPCEPTSLATTPFSTRRHFGIQQQVFSPLTTSKLCQALAAETSTKMTMIAMRGCRRPGHSHGSSPFPPPPVPLLPYSRTFRAPTGLQPQASCQMSNNMFADSFTSFDESTFTCFNEAELLETTCTATTSHHSRDIPRSLAVDYRRRSILNQVAVQWSRTWRPRSHSLLQPTSIPSQFWHISACSSTAANTDDPSQVMEHVSRNNPSDREREDRNTGATSKALRWRYQKETQHSLTVHLILSGFHMQSSLS